MDVERVEISRVGLVPKLIPFQREMARVDDLEREALVYSALVRQIAETLNHPLPGQILTAAEMLYFHSFYHPSGIASIKFANALASLKIQDPELTRFIKLPGVYHRETRPEEDFNGFAHSALVVAAGKASWDVPGVTTSDRMLNMFSYALATARLDVNSKRDVFANPFGKFFVAWGQDVMGHPADLQKPINKLPEFIETKLQAFVRMRHWMFSKPGKHGYEIKYSVATTAADPVSKVGVGYQDDFTIGLFPRTTQHIDEMLLSLIFGTESFQNIDGRLVREIVSLETRQEFLKIYQEHRGELELAGWIPEQGFPKRVMDQVNGGLKLDSLIPKVLVESINGVGRDNQQKFEGASNSLSQALRGEVGENYPFLLRALLQITTEKDDPTKKTNTYSHPKAEKLMREAQELNKELVSRGSSPAIVGEWYLLDKERAKQPTKKYFGKIRKAVSHRHEPYLL